MVRDSFQKHLNLTLQFALVKSAHELVEDFDLLIGPVGGCVDLEVAYLHRDQI